MPLFLFLDPGLLCTGVPELPAHFAPRISESLDPRPVSAAGEMEHPGKAVVPEFMEHSVSVAQPTHPLRAVLEKDLPTTVDTGSLLGISTDASAPGQGFPPAVGKLGE